MKYILGGLDPELFLACMFFAGLGILFVLLLGTNLRQTDSTGKVQAFSWAYLWSDNFKRILASLIAVLVTLRFMTELIGIPLSPFNAFCIGTAWDGIALLIKQKSTILDPKPKP
jgi:hypothetical protein